MRKEFNLKLFLVFLVTLMQISAVFAIEAQVGYLKKNENAFDLFTLAETLLNQDSVPKSGAENQKQKVRHQFNDATQKFNQGNVATAYDEYHKIIDELDNDLALLSFSKFLYKKGFFTLGEIAISRIKNQDSLQAQILDLKRTYQNNFTLDKNEEIYLAKAYVSIVFDNSAQEAAFDLNKKENLIAKSDQANYIMAQAFFELKQYNQALNYIKDAIEIAPKNSNYYLYKAKILSANKNYIQALKIVEREDIQTLNLQSDFLVLRHSILASLAKKPTDKKYQNALSAYHSGNYYKTISNCRAAIALDKKNIDAINLLAKSQLKTADIEEAEHNFNLSNSVDKSNFGAIVGLGDINFINSNFQEANILYKKAYAKNSKNPELILKLILTNEITGDEKSLVKFKKSLMGVKKQLYFENYEIATTILNNITISPNGASNLQNANIKNISNNLQAQYLKNSLIENPFNINGWFELVLLNSLKPNFTDALMQIATLNGEFDYMYYYALAKTEYAKNNYETTIEYLNAALALNPQFEPAGKLLLNIKVKQL